MRKLYKKLPNPVNRTVKFPISQFHFDHHNPEALASAAYQDVPLIRRRLSPSVSPAIALPIAGSYLDRLQQTLHVR